MKPESITNPDECAHAHDSPRPNVVADELSFKLKLGIGDALLKKLKARDHLSTLAEAMGVGTTASAVAASTTVASALAPSPAVALGVAGASGLASLATPLPWIVGAGLAAGSAYLGVAKWLGDGQHKDWVVIPKYAGTPLDLVGASLLDLMLPLSLSFAAEKEEIPPELEHAVHDYYVTQWGYSAGYYQLARATVSREGQENPADRLANALGEFSDSSIDCHTPALLNDFECHLDSLLALQNGSAAQQQRLGALKADVFQKFSQNTSKFQQLRGQTYATASMTSQLAQHRLSRLRKRLTDADERLRDLLAPYR